MVRLGRAELAAAMGAPAVVVRLVLGPDGADGGHGGDVVLDDTDQTAVTGADGQFLFGNLPPAIYSITFALGHNAVTIPGVRVTPGATTSSGIRVACS